MRSSSPYQGNSWPIALFNHARKAHKWLMALVGLQVFLWALTGAYMVFPNIHYIHGDHLVKHTMPSLHESDIKLSFDQVLSRYPSATNVRLGWLGERAVYRFSYYNEDSEKTNQVLLDANTGMGIRPLQVVDIVNLVPDLLTLPNVTDSFIASAVLIEIDSPDYPQEIGKNGLPLWQIELNSWDSTRLYISQYSGEIIYVRHHAWRLFDLFWRLHIMDYNKGDEPENWLLAISSVLTLCSILAGLLVLYSRMLSVAKTVRSSEHAPEAEVQAATVNLSRAKIQGITTRLKTYHKWLALLVFVQLLLWVISGFLLARMDHPLATGQLTQIAKPPLSPISADDAQKLLPIAAILTKSQPAQAVYLDTLLGQWVYRVEHAKGRHDYLASDYSVFNAYSGEEVFIEQEMAEELALATYENAELTQSPGLTSAERFSSPIPALPKEQNAVWRVGLDDELNTHILLNAQTGSLIAHTNKHTAWRNLLFKLHFMDYANEGSFNNGFIKLFALLTLLLSITGLYWLYELLKAKQFAIPLGSLVLFKQRKIYINIIYSQPRSNGKYKSHYKIKTNSRLTILDGLTKKGFKLDSECGGGGVCGQCVCQLQNTTKITPSEKQCLSEEQLNDNYRLACQHTMSATKRITLYR